MCAYIAKRQWLKSLAIGGGGIERVEQLDIVRATHPHFDAQFLAAPDLAAGAARHGGENPIEILRQVDAHGGRRRYVRSILRITTGGQQRFDLVAALRRLNDQMAHVPARATRSISSRTSRSGWRTRRPSAARAHVADPAQRPEALDDDVPAADERSAIRTSTRQASKPSAFLVSAQAAVCTKSPPGTAATNASHSSASDRLESNQGAPCEVLCEPGPPAKGFSLQHRSVLNSLMTPTPGRRSPIPARSPGRSGRRPHHSNADTWGARGFPLRPGRRPAAPSSLGSLRLAGDDRAPGSGRRSRCPSARCCLRRSRCGVPLSTARW